MIVKDKDGNAMIQSERELKLRYVISVNKVRRFFDGLQEGKVYFTKCIKCGAKYFPPQADCPACGSSEMEWIPITGRGKLVALTIINVKPSSFSGPDYAVGVARFGELGVVAWLDIDASIARDSVRPGVDVELVVKDGRYWLHPIINA
ncbi:hypothetical protein GCM10007981_18950 [Thermocladium modestius]|uniref:DNA-binding protein n=1 Tax=Thermocladium modestius TaxID=62609 RepID=A0A830GZU7_9CREN|nr:Zn-ribbon domain-containing OB-fold protein [Thermocladium modestius]GGP22527.1 hypothetical protein GCM10007981_18950 [Thermocladium modestius]